VIAAELLDGVGISRDVSAAAFLLLCLVGWLTYRRFALNERLAAIDLLLVSPAFLISVLVELRETGLLRLPSGVIWTAAAVATILVVGCVEQAANRADTD
jgi:hypothetical protein